MKASNRCLITIVLFFVAITLTAIAQSYTLPDLSPKDVAEWVQQTGFIATGNGDPTVTEGVESGYLYIDISATDTPKLWRFNGNSWAQMSGADPEALTEHLASTQDPHGESMGVSENITVGDPDEDPWSHIDSPVAGGIRIASFVILIPIATAPTVVDGGIYKSTDGHFYGCDGASWTQLDN